MVTKYLIVQFHEHYVGAQAIITQTVYSSVDTAEKAETVVKYAVKLHKDLVLAVIPVYTSSGS